MRVKLGQFQGGIRGLQVGTPQHSALHTWRTWHPPLVYY